MSEICFTKAVSGEEMELLAKKEALKMLAKLQGITDDQMKVIFREKKAYTIKDEVKALEEITEKAEAKMSKSTEKETNTQQIVDESELPNHLSHGWRFVACLSNGKCVVEKNGH